MMAAHRSARHDGTPPVFAAQASTASWHVSGLDTRWCRVKSTAASPTLAPR